MVVGRSSEQKTFPNLANNFLLDLSFSRLSDKDQLSSPNGCDGKYRRTASPPSTPSSNGHHYVDSAGNSNGVNKTPAMTPKRKSPATIAAKGEPCYFA